eukprot:sb/3472763/
MMHKLLPVARYFRYLSPSAPLGEEAEGFKLITCQRQEFMGYIPCFSCLLQVLHTKKRENTNQNTQRGLKNSKKHLTIECVLFGNKYYGEKERNNMIRGMPDITERDWDSETEGDFKINCQPAGYKPPPSWLFIESAPVALLATGGLFKLAGYITSSKNNQI